MSTDKKVVVALSGGVDSTVAALLLRQQGFEVIGATLKMLLPSGLSELSEKSCVKENDRSISELAAKLGIEHHFIDVSELFHERILHFCACCYEEGRTPNPCVYCNRLLKFGVLIDFARKISAGALATGHYVSLTEKDRQQLIVRGSDPRRDQSYFLYQLTREQLNFLRFPLGEMDKDAVRSVAAEFKLANADKKDSQDACFNVAGESFPESLHRHFALAEKKGCLVDMQGRVIGTHNGIHRYTIGQRKGLNIALGVPAYVQKIDPVSNNITVTTDPDDLLSNSMLVSDLNWQIPQPVFAFECEVQIRYRSRAVKAVLYEEGTELRVEFLSPQRAVTPGQAAVFYKDDILLGGGIIL